jgi:hypothetical protein
VRKQVAALFSAIFVGSIFKSRNFENILKSFVLVSNLSPIFGNNLDSQEICFLLSFK